MRRIWSKAVPIALVLAFGATAVSAEMRHSRKTMHSQNGHALDHEMMMRHHKMHHGAMMGDHHKHMQMMTRRNAAMRGGKGHGAMPSGVKRSQATTRPVRRGAAKSVHAGH